MKHRLATAVLLSALAQSALADENRIYLLQVSSNPGNGNTLFVDQSNATGSLVHGIAPELVPPNTLANGTPAVQFGSRNRATINLTGVGSEVRISQQGLPDNGSLTPGFSNRARVVSLGNNQVAELNQLGSNNTALIRLRPGDGTVGTLHQFGDENKGTLKIRGENTQGTLIQNGNNIDSALTVRARGADVTYKLNGNNISAPNGVVVVTNIGQVGPITITQTQ